MRSYSSNLKSIYDQVNHQTIKPSSDLSAFVKFYWNLESQKDDTPEKNTIVPDGRIKMIFHYGDKYRHHNESGDIVDLLRCLVVGQLTRPYVIEPMGQTGTFFVCFHPNGFFPFATVPIKELENKVISLEQLYGDVGKNLGDKILGAPSITERIFLIESFL